MTNTTAERRIAELAEANKRFAEVENTDDEAEFERAADARLDAEDAVLNCEGADLKDKLTILARRAAGGFDVSTDLIRVASHNAA